MLANPKAWNALSTLLLVVGVLGLLLGDDGIERWAWIALLASGVAFGIELVLLRRSKPRETRAGDA